MYMKPPNGILNIGNSCYINSVLQVLFNHKKFIRNIPSENDIMGEIIKYHHCDDEHSYDPTFFKKKINEKLFDNSHQHDSHEFLLYLLEYINNKSKKDICSNLIQIEIMQ